MGHFRTGVPVIGIVNHDESFFKIGPTTGGVKFIYHYSKEGMMIKVKFSLLGKLELVPGDLYHLTVTMSQSADGSFEVRETKKAKCCTIKHIAKNMATEITKLTFTFMEWDIEDGKGWRDVVFAGRNPKSCKENESISTERSRKDSED